MTIQILCNKAFIEVLRNIFSIIIPSLTLLYLVFKDYVYPLIFKPRLRFLYDNSPPHKRNRSYAGNNSEIIFSYYRFSVKNIGARPALNCRCQITSVKIKSSDKIYGDYEGYPLKWAGRSKSNNDTFKGERLNIALGEKEFVDIGFTKSGDELFHFEKFHDTPIGIDDYIPCGEFIIELLFSGDNFEPYKIKLTTDYAANQLNAAKVLDLKLTKP
jgi:hypothetical protein